jgi:hypothetical protein
MIAPRTIRRGKGKIEKPVSPIAPHPQSELKTPQIGAFDRDFERFCRERRKTIASYQELLEKWRAPVGPESVLPFRKSLIAAAIYQELSLLQNFSYHPCTKQHFMVVKSNG